MNSSTNNEKRVKSKDGLLLTFVKSRGFPVLVNIVVVGSILTYALLSAVPN